MMKSSERNTFYEGAAWRFPVRCRKVLFVAILLIPGGAVVRAETLLFDHDAKGSGFGNTHVPRWSGEALVNFTSNQTAAPTLLSFDDKGGQLQPIVFTIPGAVMIDLDAIARSPDGTLAVCGKAFDQSGRGSGFISILSPSGNQATIVRLLPYHPTGITFASVSTVWTFGLEAVDGKETGLDYDVIRHFDRTGKLLGSFVPRSQLSSIFVGLNGLLASANGRVGWYTGPVFGPGSRYYEFLSDGSVRNYPAIPLSKSERVNGLALLSNGRTYVTTVDDRNRIWRLLSIAPTAEQWTQVSLPDDLKRAFLYGGEGQRLVFYRPGSTMTFMHVSP
jgi:hypothetical protein